jgi:hypothetical protein
MFYGRRLELNTLQIQGRSAASLHIKALRIIIIFNYALQPLRLIVRSGLDVPTFATRRLHAYHHARAPNGVRWNCGREMSGNFAQMPIYTLHLGIFYMP